MLCNISFVHQIPACDRYAVTMHVAPSVSPSIMKLKEMKQSHLNKTEIHPLTCFFKSLQFLNDKNHHLYNKNANVIIFYTCLFRNVLYQYNES